MDKYERGKCPNTPIPKKTDKSEEREARKNRGRERTSDLFRPIHPTPAIHLPRQRFSPASVEHLKLDERGRKAAEARPSILVPVMGRRGGTRAAPWEEWEEQGPGAAPAMGKNGRAGAAPATERIRLGKTIPTK